MLEEGRTVTVDLYQPADAEPGYMNFMVYSEGEPIALSEVLPVLENMGVDVYTERPYELTLPTGPAGRCPH